MARGLAICALVAILGLLLATAVDPASGTGTNFQPADDVAGLIVGAHHAKPLPQRAAVVMSAVLAILAAAVIAATVPVLDAVVLRVSCRRCPPRPALGSSLAWAVDRARRGPPALV